MSLLYCQLRHCSVAMSGQLCEAHIMFVSLAMFGCSGSWRVVGGGCRASAVLQFEAEAGVDICLSCG